MTWALTNKENMRGTATALSYDFADSVSSDTNYPTDTLAIDSTEKDAWLTSIQEEFYTFKHYSVGALVGGLPRENILGVMWVLNCKKDKRNRVCQWKACWVVFGNNKFKGLDYNNIHVLAGMTELLQILFPIVAVPGMKFYQSKIRTVFLKRDMRGILYSWQGTGFIHPTYSHHICLLKDSIYMAHGRILASARNISKRLPRSSISYQQRRKVLFMCVKMTWDFCFYTFMSTTPWYLSAWMRLWCFSRRSFMVNTR